MEKLYPAYEDFAPDDIYSDLSFPITPWDRPYAAMNMVTTVDGRATNPAGTAAALGSRADRMAMRRIRAAVDGVMCGAETLRRENVNPTVPDQLVRARVSRGLSPQPIALTVTASCDIPLDRTFFQMPGIERVIVTTREAPADRVERLAPYARILRAGERSVDLRLMMTLLRNELGIRRLLVEGGPGLNAGLISLGMVDELFWTVAPKILGGSAHRTMVGEIHLPPQQRPELEIVSVHRHESELFLRYRFVRAG